MKNAARIAAIHPNVSAAFFALGDLNALTPFEIASVPVIATQPSAKARSTRNVSANPTGGVIPCRDAETASTRGIALEGAGRCPENSWYMPTPIIASMRTMKTYVGMLKAMPDSRTPLRFTAISTNVDAMQRATACGASAEYAEVIAATPAEIETAT